MCPEPSAEAKSYAVEETERLFDWYVTNSKSTRLRYQLSEVLLLIVASSVPVTGILTPGDARIPAILGAVVVLLTGLRSVFHWRDNWTRFTFACNSLNIELRLYRLGTAPYDDPDTRDALLLEQTNKIERTETTGWMSLSGPETSPHTSG